MPELLINHLRAALQLSPKIIPVVIRRTLCRRHNFVRVFLNVRSYYKTARKLITKTVFEAARVMDNPTHKTKMKTDFYQKLNVPMTIRFHHFPTYSPLCNPTEYLIHLIRQKYLHHHDYKLNLQELKKILTDNLLAKTFISKEQLVNILEHINNLVLSTQREYLSALGGWHVLLFGVFAGQIHAAHCLVESRGANDGTARD